MTTIAIIDSMIDNDKLVIEDCILGNGGIVVGFVLNKIRLGFDGRDRSVVRLNQLLVVDRDQKIISRIAFELGSKSLDDKGG